MGRAVVAVFAKSPVPGRVKTRLAATVGPERAAQLAAALLADAWEAASACPWARVVLATTHPAEDHGLGPVEAWDQGEGDLGARVERVLRRGVEAEGAAFAVGADTALLSAARLDVCWDALHEQEAVLAPALDGGFWLLGLRRCPEGLLAALPWSAPNTHDAVRARLLSVLGACAEGPTGFDVDTQADLDRLLAHGAAAGRAGAVARAWG